MKISTIRPSKSLIKKFDKLSKSPGSEDVSIDIFCESMTNYLQKLDAASAGRYELDDYDMQVINIAMEQFAGFLTGNLKR